MNGAQPRVVAIDARGYFTGGGIGRYTRSLVRALAASCGPRIALRLLISNCHEPGDVDLSPDADRHVEVRVSRATWMNGAEEDRWLAEETAGADLFHSLTGHWMPREGGIATLHDLTPLVRPRLASIDARRTGQRIAEHAGRASHLVVVSHSTARDARAVLASRVPPMTVIPEAAAATFKPGAPAEAALARYGLERDRFLLTVSVLNPHKNVARLIDAYAASGVDSPLVIAGAHRDDTGRVQAAIARSHVEDRVTLVGRVSDEDLAALYGSCRVFVYPSLYEGFGLPVVEALACGAAVVASRTSSIPEVTGDAALLADPGRTRSLAAALRRVNQDTVLREKLRRLAVVRAATFSWSRTATATLGVYESVLEGRAA
jgi:glycosyltransferase involved in cell wall biosynthesis